MGKYGIEPAVSLLGLPPVSLDPGGHEVEDFGLEVSWPALRILAVAHQSCIFQHPEVLGHGRSTRCRGGQLASRGVPNSESSHNVTSCRVGQCGEDS